METNHAYKQLGQENRNKEQISPELLWKIKKWWNIKIKWTEGRAKPELLKLVREKYTDANKKKLEGGQRLMKDYI